MRLLVDTHAFLWFQEDRPSLSPEARRTIVDPDNEVHFSVASLWEIAIKIAIGKLDIRPEVMAFMASDKEGHRLLAISPQHALAVARLPLHHHDPFDRLLIAQALHEGLTLVTHDRRLADYGVPILWT